MTNWTLFSLLSTVHGICQGEEFYAISKETHHSVHCKLSSDYDKVIVLSDDDEKDVIYGILYDKHIISRKKFKPRRGEKYYIVAGYNAEYSYIVMEWKGSLEDFANYMSGNCFPAYVANSVPADDMYTLLRKWQDKLFADSDGIPYDDIVGSIDPMYLTREKDIRKGMDKHEAENH